MNVCNFVNNVSQVQKVKRDYERLSKKHVKQIKDHQRDRDKSHTDLQDSSTEIGRLNNKILVSTRPLT